MVYMVKLYKTNFVRTVEEEEVEEEDPVGPTLGLAMGLAIND